MPWRLRLLARVGSTQDLVLAAARAGVPEGLCVIADEQVSGRGRAGRRWQAPPGSSLMLSLLWRPPPDRPVSPLPLVVGLAVARGIEAAGGPPVQLKWPNDCLIAGRKVAGVLVESRAGGDGLVVAVGVGCNVSWGGLTPDGPITLPATSLDHEGWGGGRTELAAEVLAALHDQYWSWREGGFERLRTAWMERAAWRDQEVRVATAKGSLVGRLEGVDGEGRLLLAGPDGQRAVAAGDLELASPAAVRPTGGPA